MDAVNRVKLARYHQRRGLRMLKCARGVELDTHSVQFRRIAATAFEQARFCMLQARIEAGMVKLRGWWVTECGNRSVLVYAYSAEEAVGIARDSGDWFGDDQDIALLETSVRPMAHIYPSVIAWASDLSFEL